MYIYSIRIRTEQLPRGLLCTLYSMSMCTYIQMIDCLVHYAKLWAPWCAYAAIAYLNPSLSHAATVAARVVAS